MSQSKLVKYVEYDLSEYLHQSDYNFAADGSLLNDV